MKPILTIPSVLPIRRPSYGAPPARHPNGELTCEGCSHCCHYVSVEIDKPTAKRDYDNLIWFLLHDGVSVWVDFESRWFIQFDTTCRALTKDGLCGVYEERPQICRDYKIDECVRHNEEPPEKLLFRTQDEFIAYLERRKVSWRWKRRGEGRSRTTRERAHPGEGPGSHDAPEGGVLYRKKAARAERPKKRVVPAG